jgi:hypothetical protein
MDGRHELCQLLDAAARAEQALLCRYLFAAFSMKRTHDEGGVTYEQIEHMRRWEANILTVARQEMEHLGLVFNLRTAIGMDATFEMPAFPFTEDIEGTAVVHSLDRFSEETIIKFALIELPRKLPESSPNYVLLEKLVEGFNLEQEDALARLYKRIRKLFKKLPQKILFIGPPAAQFNTHDIFPGSIRGLDISKAPAYNVQMEEVKDRKSALAVIDQITTEGEGAKEEGGPGSHFATFMNILRDLVAMQKGDPDFVPGRPVVSNPVLASSAQAAAAGGDSEVNWPFARDALKLFETSYETMLLGLSRFFSFPEDDKEEMAALQQAVFFPMMTTIIRPLGEILTMVPSDKCGAMTERAGASFHSPATISFSPHKDAMFKLLYQQYTRMKKMAASLLDKCADLPDDVPRELIRERVDFLYQQIYRSRFNLKVNYEKKPDAI